MFSGVQFTSIGPEEKENKLSSHRLNNKADDMSSIHVMISYHRSQRPLVSAIHDRLKQEKLNVWIDINDLHGVTLDVMAKAVENAEVVLVCYSPQYKTSDNCRAGIFSEYQRNHVIPSTAITINSFF